MDKTTLTAGVHAAKDNVRSIAELAAEAAIFADGAQTAAILMRFSKYIAQS